MKKTSKNTGVKDSKRDYFEIVRQTPAHQQPAAEPVSAIRKKLEKVKKTK